MKRMFKILFEDDLILAIDKPSGLPSNSLVHSLKSCESVLRAARPGETLMLVHRLDTGTSGVLIFAKNENAFLAMREQFKLKTIQKKYIAWSEKTNERETLLKTLQFPWPIELPMAHHAKSKKKMIALGPNDRHFRGKPIPASSLLHFASSDLFFGIPAIRFELEITTGVMHQIRVHMSELGFALIGDDIYGKKANAAETRLGLHAEKTSFKLLGFHYELESTWPDLSV
jgi:23S rRNA-/tRNA-specific pseudouridylate synthase